MREGVEVRWRCSERVLKGGGNGDHRDGQTERDFADHIPPVQESNSFIKKNVSGWTT